MFENLISFLLFSFFFFLPFSSQVVFPSFFSANPDFGNSKFSSEFGIYTPNCGIDQVHMSFGHDEYLYMAVKDYLPLEALYVIRYHSFYAAHRENGYDHLMNDVDRKMFRWVRFFNPFDLYTKGDAAPDVEALKPYYVELINEFFPEKIRW